MYVCMKIFYMQLYNHYIQTMDLAKTNRAPAACMRIIPAGWQRSRESSHVKPVALLQVTRIWIALISKVNVQSLTVISHKQLYTGCAGAVLKCCKEKLHLHKVLNGKACVANAKLLAHVDVVALSLQHHRHSLNSLTREWQERNVLDTGVHVKCLDHSIYSVYYLRKIRSHGDLMNLTSLAKPG